ncbi:MAG: sigma-54-dependent Fis family transcriptional regulator [Desulfovibrionaceae bacterium]|nr:sigma-54-dependent Fis family transcriptional regulator [Desulfovibrionaceae bacterium]
MASILIVDDDAQLRKSFQRVLAAEGFATRTASSGEDGIKEVAAERPDLVVMDVRLPGMNGLEAFKAMREREPALPVIIMTAYGTTDTAIEATKMGAFDYVLKPFDVPAVLALIDKALSTAVREQRTPEAAGHPQPDVLLGRSQAMQDLCKAIGRAAPTDATILIQGESGTGKELIARTLHRHSLRAERPFQVINCVAIPETLLESELFGYEKGAFTGASNRRVGKIEQANRGTVFLDEIGDMPLGIQAKLLRLLQERQIERLGGHQTIAVDVRILAATNRDLEAAVAAGHFREDLYYRLKVVTLSLPPLRERSEDVPILARHFLERFAAELGVPNPGLTVAAERLLIEHDWPGNVRELANAVHKGLIFSRGGPLEAEDLAETLAHSGASDAPGAADAEEVMRRWVRARLKSADSDNLFESMADRFGALIVAEALAMTGGNRTRAAKLLGLSRPTLLARIDKYGLKVTTSVA